MYQFIFFDLDGTLTDSREGIVKSLGYAFERLGDPTPDAAILNQFIGPPLQDSFMRYCGYDAEKALRGIELFRERYVPVGKFENAAAPGLPELCARLKDWGRVLALSSSKPEDLCVDICQKFGYAASLSAIVGSAPGADWEKADVIRETMGRLGLTGADRGRILMVGDRKFDVLGAAAYGIDCVGVEFFGYAEPGELRDAGAAAVVRTVAELEEFLLAH